MATAVGPRGLLAAIAAGAVAVLALWWNSTFALSGPGGWLTGAGEVLGLLAGGPPGMTGTAVAALTEAGVPRRRIHYESFEF